MLTFLTGTILSVQAQDEGTVSEQNDVVTEEVFDGDIEADIDESISVAIEPTTGDASVYKIDNVHSTIGFAVKHLVVSTTRGSFSDYEGTVKYDPTDLSSFEANVAIQAASIDTNNEKRDAHLKSDEFFGVEEFPLITFKSTSLEKDEEGDYVIIGSLSIRDVTKEIKIPVEINGPVQSPQGFLALGIIGETSIDRQDYNVSWSKTLDNGGLMVSDTVRLIVELELHLDDK